MSSSPDVAIIGAGPYGLSLAAHLAAKGVSFRIFGTPMQTWRTAMLAGSHLKSEGFATDLYEPTRRFTLKAYCAQHGLPYADIGVPVALETFVDYGMAFQQRYVPRLEQRDIVDVSAMPGGFTLRADDGEMITARRVVVAAGISKFRYTPDVLAALPDDFGSHSGAHSKVDHLAGRDVVIVGGGASAADLAMALLDAGASVRIVARREKMDFNGPPRDRSLWERITAPWSGVGPSWKGRLCTDAPMLFHAMPEDFRIRVVKRFLGPAACWFTREAVEGKAEFLGGRHVTHATVQDGKVRLGLTQADGTREELTADHVIGATGYQVDLAKLAFLPAELRAAIKLCDKSPALSRQFESSVPGLYFVGVAAANSFGPVSRFAFGAGFTSARLSAHLAKKARARVPVMQPATA
jgi:cation diffusion facilitator CzcD-associated flavoprotein CzcO